MSAPRRHSMGSDSGLSQTSVIATLVGIMIAGAVAALLFVAFSGNGSSKGHGNDVAAAATPSTHATVSSPSATLASAPPASTSTLTLTSTAASATVSATPPARSTSSPTTNSQPAVSPKPTASSTKPRKPLTYTVLRGDNLFNIAKWFHLHGYGDLYERNKAVIGANPNLIFPGQKITISSAGMTVGH